MNKPTAEKLAEENATPPMTGREIGNAMRAARQSGSELPANVQTALAQRKNQHLVAAKMSEMNWGKGLDELTRRAVASYLERNKLDLTEVDVLGGNLYRNARYYKRRLAEMVEDNRVEYVKSDWVQHDERLKAMAERGDEWAKAERDRRERVRIEYGIPEAATGACVFRIKIRGVDVEFTAAKWCGGGTQKKNGRGGQVYDGDPIGDLCPIETSETRACRRAMTLCASSIPALKWREDELNESGIELGAVLKEGIVRSEGQEVFPVHPAPLIQHPGDDPYAAPPTPREAPTEKDDDLLEYDRAIAERDG